MLLLASFIFFLQAADASELEPIEILGNEERKEELRSVPWMTQTTEAPLILTLPQLEDGLNGINGLQTRSQGSPTFSIRGSAQSARTLTLYNDIPLNFSTGFGAPSIFVPKEMLQEITIVKGPASLFYGSQAMAGVVNFVSKKYTAPELTLTASDTNESFLPWRKGGLAHNSLQIASPLINNTNHFLQASFFSESDDGQFPYQTQNASGVRNFNAQNQTRWVVGGKSRFKNLSLQYDSIYGKQIKQSPGPTNFYLPTREDSEGLLTSVSPHLFITDEHSVRSKISYLSYNSDFLESGAITDTKQKTFIFQNEWVYDIDPNTQLQLFGDFFSHSFDNTISGNGLKQEQFEIGPFFRFHSSKNWEHQVGGRYLSFSDKMLPSASTSYLWGDFKTWLSYAQGFRNPSLSDLYSKSPFFVGNPNLRPEQSEQFEVGIKKSSLTNYTGWLFDLRWFHINYKNFIELQQVSPAVLSRFNQGAGHSQGVDVDLSWQSPQFYSGINYNFLHTKNGSTGNAFRLSPTHQVNLSMIYKFTRVHLEVQNTRWYDFYDIAMNQNVRMNDWQQWNFLVHLLQKQRWRFSLGLINAFNEGKELTVYYPEPQRKYWLQLNYSFGEN